MPIPLPNINSFAVVTGASQGIGRALAMELAQQGHNLMLIARRENILNELATELTQKHGVKTLVRAIDLSNPEARTPLINELKTLNISVLCNNAGIASFGAILDQDPDLEKSQVQLDVNAAFDLALAVLPNMKQNQAGGILMVGSAAGNMPIPYNTTYCASKAFINSFSEALRTEVKDYGIHVTLLAPGPVRPDGTEKSTNSNSEETSFIDKSVPDFLWVSTKQTAKISLKKLAKNKPRVVPGTLSKVMSVVGGYSPRTLVAPLVAKFFKSMAAKQK